MSFPRRLLLTTDAVGGVWTYSVELAQALAVRGTETILAVLGPPVGDERKAEAHGLRLVDTGLPLDWTATDRETVRRSARSLAQLAAQEGADLLQVHSAALLAGTHHSVPTVAVQHSCLASWWEAVRGGLPPAEFAWRIALCAEGLERADATVAPTASFARTTERLYRLRRPVRAVHNGRSAREETGGPVQPRILTAGRLWDEGKNARTLDRAAARLSAPFEAAGPLQGPNGTSIALGHMRALGPIESGELRERMRKRPIFASAALYEPFGLAPLEAAQAGCPLVLSDIPAHRELWNGAALFVPARDPSAFADALQLLVDDVPRRERLGEAARQQASRYTSEATAAAMLRIYCEFEPNGATAQPELAGAA
jgi:glycosyltransferase involved in cell wall biosynthesis